MNGDVVAPYVPPRTPINTISRSNRFNIHLIGKVIMTSGIHDWESLCGDGKKLFFDVADETGIIRVFAWEEAATKVSDLIQRGKIIEIIDVFVDPRNRQFNNLPHPFEIQLNRDATSIVRMLPDNTEMTVPEEEHAFVPFSDVINFPENEYFNVTGKVHAIYPEPPVEGVGLENQNPYTKQVVELQNDEGKILRVMSWNGYIPLSDDTIGKTMSLIRCKYIREWDNVNSSGSLILIDDEPLLGSA